VVINAGSLLPPAHPGGSIARGSIFVLSGRNLGPSESVTASEYPQSIALAGVSVEISQGTVSMPAIPLVDRYVPPGSSNYGDRPAGFGPGPSTQPVRYQAFSLDQRLGNCLRYRHRQTEVARILVRANGRLNRLALSLDGGSLFVNAELLPLVFRIDTGSNRLDEEIRTGQNNPDSSMIFVTP
jgi:hypothetical protein